MLNWHYSPALTTTDDFNDDDDDIKAVPEILQKIYIPRNISN